MSTIVTRAGKGSALSYAEMDANFTNLNTDKLEASSLTPYLLSATASATYATLASVAAKEPTIVAGIVSQYWRGDKTWQTLDKNTISLGNVDNTSDATKNAAAVTLTNKTFALGSNTFSGTMTQFNTSCSDGDFGYVGTIQTWTASQRGTQTTDNDLSFDLNVTNNFFCTLTAGATLTFTNLVAGQAGTVILVNGSNYAIAKAASVKVDSSFLTAVSATGTYRLSYYCDGTNVYVTTSQALS